MESLPRDDIRKTYSAVKLSGHCAMSARRPACSLILPHSRQNYSDTIHPFAETAAFAAKLAQRAEAVATETANVKIQEDAQVVDGCRRLCKITANEDGDDAGVWYHVHHMISVLAVFSSSCTLQRPKSTMS
jgi:hypothetical protein